MFVCVCDGNHEENMQKCKLQDVCSHVGTMYVCAEVTEGTFCGRDVYMEMCI